MDRIPKEVLGLIFSFLSERFRRYIEVTCKEWRNLIRNEPHIISLKIRDLSQYFPNSDFPSFDKVKEIEITVMYHTEFILKLIQIPNLKITITQTQTNDNPTYCLFEEVKRLIIDNKINDVHLVKHFHCFVCNHEYTVEESHGSRGNYLWGVDHHKTICVLCKRMSYCYCLDELVKKTCGEEMYCYDCIDVAIATKRVITCKKCDGYFDTFYKKDICCKECGILTSCYLKRCVKCKQEVCKTCQPGTFCKKCLYMCTTCKKISGNLVRCKKCMLTRYCSEECQTVDLDKHTKTCTLHLKHCRYCGKQNNRQFEISYRNRYDWNAAFHLGYQMSRNQTKFTKRCSECKMVSYCSTICQHKDWKRHKEHCFKL